MKTWREIDETVEAYASGMLAIEKTHTMTSDSIRIAVKGLYETALTFIHANALSESDREELANILIPALCEYKDYEDYNPIRSFEYERKLWTWSDDDCVYYSTHSDEGFLYDVPASASNIKIEF